MPDKNLNLNVTTKGVDAAKAQLGALTSGGIAAALELAAGGSKVKAAWEGIKWTAYAKAGAGGMAALSLSTMGVVKALRQMVYESGKMEEALRRVADIEMRELQFKPLLGGIELAKQRMAELVEFTATTPFNLPEVAEASRTLEVFGRGGLSSVDTLRQMGDAAAVSKRGMQEVSFWIGRLYDGLQSGRPVGQAATRLQEMALISGKTRARIEELTKGGGDMAVVWKLITKELEKNQGATKDLSESIEGLKTTLSDTRDLMAQKFGDPFKEIEAEKIQRTIDTTKNLTPIVEDLGRNLARFEKIPFLGKAKKGQIKEWVTGMKGFTDTAQVAWRMLVLMGVASTALMAIKLTKWLWGVKAAGVAASLQLKANAASSTAAAFAYENLAFAAFKAGNATKALGQSILKFLISPTTAAWVGATALIGVIWKMVDAYVQARKELENLRDSHLEFNEALSDEVSQIDSVEAKLKAYQKALAENVRAKKEAAKDEANIRKELAKNYNVEYEADEVNLGKKEADRRRDEKVDKDWELLQQGKGKYGRGPLGVPTVRGIKTEGAVEVYQEKMRQADQAQRYAEGATRTPDMLLKRTERQVELDRERRERLKEEKEFAAAREIEKSSGSRKTSLMAARQRELRSEVSRAASLEISQEEDVAARKLTIEAQSGAFKHLPKEERPETQLAELMRGSGSELRQRSQLLEDISKGSVDQKTRTAAFTAADSQRGFLAEVGAKDLGGGQFEVTARQMGKLRDAMDDLTNLKEKLPELRDEIRDLNIAIEETALETKRAEAELTQAFQGRMLREQDFRGGLDPVERAKEETNIKVNGLKAQRALLKDGQIIEKKRIDEAIAAAQTEGKFRERAARGELSGQLDTEKEGQVLKLHDLQLRGLDLSKKQGEIELRFLGRKKALLDAGQIEERKRLENQERAVKNAMDTEEKRADRAVKTAELSAKMSKNEASVLSGNYDIAQNINNENEEAAKRRLDLEEQVGATRADQIADSQEEAERVSTVEGIRNRIRKLTLQTQGKTGKLQEMEDKEALDKRVKQLIDSGVKGEEAVALAGEEAKLLMGLQAGAQSPTTVSSSLARIGGGGGVFGTDPAVIRLDRQIKIEERMAELLEDIRDNGNSSGGTAKVG